MNSMSRDCPKARALFSICILILALSACKGTAQDSPFGRLFHYLNQVQQAERERTLELRMKQP